MTTLFPELARSPAPDWVKPGVELSFHSASAIIAGDGPVFQLDPQGDLVATDGSGRRYSMKPGGRITNGLLDGGHSGHGFVKATIVAAGADTVAIAVDVYTISGGIEAPRISARTAFVGPPGAAGDLWVSPVWLAGVEAGTKNPMFRVLRMEWPDGRATRNAVVFAANDGSMVLAYDRESGILLYRGGSGEGEKGVNLRVNGLVVSNTPTRLLTVSELAGRRTPALPWAGLPSPEGADRLRTLRYEGQVGIVVPGSPNLPLPYSLDLRAADRGPGWVRFRAVETAGGAGGALPVVTEELRLAGPDQLGGLWIAPAALAKLRPGQVLDRDPLTGFTTAVASADADAVTLVRSGVGQTLEAAYDRRTGLLVSFGREDRGLAGSMVWRARLRSSE